jgi:hypothetical protein
VFAVAMRQPDPFAGSLSKVIELRTFCFSASNRFDTKDIGRMKREDALDTLVIYDSPNREGLIHAAPLSCDYCAGEDLGTLPVAFFYSRTHINHIAYFKMRYIFPETFALNSIKHPVFH